MSSGEETNHQEHRSIFVKYKGWGSRTVRVWILQKDTFRLIVPEGFVIWKIENVSEYMWTPGIYEVYKIFSAEPDRYESQEKAKESDYRSCKVEHVAIRREKPLQEPETYVKLLEDFKPHLSHKHYEELLQELEGKTPEEKEEIILEAMDSLTSDMSYY